MNTALRPMSTSEILDRSFSLYRNNFLLFAGIAALPAVLKLVLDLVQLSSTADTLSLGWGLGVSAARSSQSSNPLVSAFLLLIIYLVVTVIGTGATVYAVSMVYLGKSASIGGSYSGIRQSIPRLIGIILLLFILFFAVGLIAIGIPLFAAISSGSVWAFFLILGLGSLCLLHLYVCYSVAPSACVIEDSGVIGSLSRSLVLTKGSRGRIWLVLLLTLVLNLALGFAILALTGTLVRVSHSGLVGALFLIVGQFFVSILVAPVLAVPVILIYYDQRVRKEAFDLQLMMEALNANPNQAATAPAG